MDHYTQTNGIQLHYLEHRGGTPLVLVPGLTANCHSFDGLIQAGLTPRLGVLALDMRGRGKSDKPDTGYTMADHAADVIGLLDTLGLEQIVMGGHSFGGLLTLYMAAHYPERIARMVIIDAAIAIANEGTRERIRPALARLEQTYPSWWAYIDVIKQAPYFHGWKWDPLIEQYYQADVEMLADGSVQPRSNPMHIAAAMDGVINEPWAEHVAKITQPGLLLHAPGPYGPPGSPPITAREQAQEMLDLLPDYHYVEVPGNHMTMLYGAGAQCMAEAIEQFALSERVA